MNIWLNSFSFFVIIIFWSKKKKKKRGKIYVIKRSFLLLRQLFKFLFGLWFILDLDWWFSLKFVSFFFSLSLNLILFNIIWVNIKQFLTLPDFREKKIKNLISFKIVHFIYYHCHFLEDNQLGNSSVIGPFFLCLSFSL